MFLRLTAVQRALGFVSKTKESNMDKINFVSKDNNFNFLRLTLASLVLLAHSFELVDGNRHREILTKIFHTISFGDLAVDGFFLLSGYMIIKSWMNDSSLKRFLLKRIARIYPGFIVATLLSILLFAPMGASNINLYFKSINYIQNLIYAILLKAPPTPEIFKATYYPVANAAMWTLSYELRCYITVALLGICGINKRKQVWLLILAILTTLMVIYPYFNINSKADFPVLFNIIGDFWEITRLLFHFSLGVCLYLYREKISYKGNWAIISLCLLFYCLFYQNIATISLGFLGGYCMFYFAFCKLNFLKIFQRVPDISYGLYLYGWPTQKVLLWYYPLLHPWALFFSALVVSSIFGFLSWELIELPSLKLLKNKIKY